MALAYPANLRNALVGTCAQVLLPTTAGDPGNDCMWLRGSASFSNRYLFGTTTCDSLNYALCYWPPQGDAYKLVCKCTGLSVSVSGTPGFL